MEAQEVDHETHSLYSDSFTGPLTDRQTAVFHQIMRDVARSQNLEQSLQLIVDKACSLTGGSNAAIMLLDSQRIYLDFAVASGADAPQIRGQRVHVDDALAGTTALTGEVFLGENLTPTTSQHNRDVIKPITSIGVQSAVVVPIFSGGFSIGAIAASDNRIGTCFDGKDVVLLQILSSAISTLLRSDKLRRDAQMSMRERDILFAASTASASSLNVQEVLSGVLETLAESMDIATSAVYLLDDEETRLYLAAERGMSEDDRERQIDTTAGFGQHVLQAEDALCIAELEDGHPLDDQPLSDVRSLMAAPLRARTAPNGVIVLGSREPRAYASRDADLLAAVARQTALALENAWLYEEATRRAQETAAIYEVAQTIGSTLDLDKVMSFVADSVLSLLQVDRFALFLLDSRTGIMEIKASRNISDDAVRTVRPGRGEGIAGWVLEFETPTAVQDVAADQRNKSCPIDQEDVISLVSVPLQTGDRVIGVMNAMSGRRRLFTVRELELLYTIGNQVAAAIVNARLYDQARRDKEELRKSVRRVARALGSSTDPAVAAQVIADMALEVAQCDRTLIYTVDGPELVVLRSAAQFRAAQASIGVPAGKDAPAIWVARHGRSLHIPSLAQDGRFTAPEFATPERVSGYLGVPLKLGHEVIGVLEVYDRTRREFTYNEVRSLLTFAAQASVGLKSGLLLARAKRRLDDLNAIDEIGRLLALGMPVDEFRRSCLALVCRATSSDCGVLEVFDEPGSRELFHSPEALEPDVADERGKIDSALLGLSEWVAKYNDTAMISGDRAADIIEALAVPLREPGGRKPAGAVVVIRVAPASPFDDYDKRLLETASRFIMMRESL